MDGIITRRLSNSKRAHKAQAARLHDTEFARRETWGPGALRTRLGIMGLTPTEICDWYGTLWLRSKDPDGNDLGMIPISASDAAELSDLNLPRDRPLPHKGH